MKISLKCYTRPAISHSFIFLHTCIIHTLQFYKQRIHKGDFRHSSSLIRMPVKSVISVYIKIVVRKFSVRKFCTNIFFSFMVLQYIELSFSHIPMNQRAQPKYRTRAAFYFMEIRKQSIIKEIVYSLI